MPRIHVIVLNGAGSVGKSTTARALQAITREPFLHVAMDTFIEMLPERMIGHPDGLTFEQVGDDATPSLAVRSGPALKGVMKGMRRCVAALAELGQNLVVDEVLIGADNERDYRASLAAFDFRLVGLFAPLDVLEAREAARGDRQIGLARWQFDRVHQGRDYDIGIDTSETTPAENARIIRDAFEL
jgi:chloramphenicol 3-O phosphotransferase